MKDTSVATANWQADPVEKSFPRARSRSNSPRKASWSNTSPTNIMRVESTNAGSPKQTNYNEISALFETFVGAEDLRSTLSIFSKIRELINPANNKELYEKLKQNTENIVRFNSLWRLLDKKRSGAEYEWKCNEKPKVVIIGAGIAGLRAAIEFSFLGGSATILEMRKSFTRHNLVHIWDSTIAELTSVGAKFFFPKFCTGGIHHVSIRRLQLLLTKVALINGVRIHSGVIFSGLKKSTKRTNEFGTVWTAKIKETSKTKPPKEDLRCNVLIGADGQNSNVAKLFEFDRKLFKGSEAIGITANFVNNQSREEIALDEFGLMSIYNKPFFAHLRDQHDIDLENLVYYRGETHYFVMTAKRESLLKRGVIKSEGPDMLSPSNINYDSLKSLVREVANKVNLPADVPFSKNHKGQDDVQIFDFSSRQESKEEFKFIKDERTKHVLPVALVGDALVEPFWPIGTGANRAVLSALDVTWVVKHFFENGKSAEKAAEECSKYYRALLSSAPTDLNPSFSEHTIDPDTRYKKAVTYTMTYQS
jgi:2-polyprenyl-6-methoxyphenol hydroxylase-like FAD-dependent oxidoreductase